MFKGPAAPLVTPFRDGSIDEAAFPPLVEWQIAEGRMPDAGRDAHSAASCGRMVRHLRGFSPTLRPKPPVAG